MSRWGKGRKPEPRPAKVRPLFPFAVTLRAAACLMEDTGRPALFLCCDDHGGLPRLYRVPTGCRVTVRAPFPLPEDGPRVFLPAGSGAVFETDTGRSALALHSVRVCRALLEAVEDHARGLRAWEAAHAHFQPGAQGEGQAAGQHGGQDSPPGAA